MILFVRLLAEEKPFLKAIKMNTNQSENVLLKRKCKILDKIKVLCKICIIKMLKGEKILDVFDVKQIQPLLRLIVKALVKAVGPDTRQHIVDSNLDTNNALTQLPGDFLNTNLRDMILDESVERKHFKRCTWTGHLLIDREYKFCGKWRLGSTLQANESGRFCRWI